MTQTREVMQMPPGEPHAIATTESVSADIAFVQMVERAATNPNVDVDKLSRLLDMRERIEAREAKRLFTDAFAAMQAELPTIDANGRIVHGEGDRAKIIAQYARWEDINDVIKPILARHGFTLDFASAERQGGGLTMTAYLTHKAGHTKEAFVPVPLDTSGAKNNVQAVGSSIAYGKRYSAGLVLNFTSRAPTDRDDDGKAAGAGETITEEQEKSLQAAIIEVDADLPKFLKYLGVEKLADLPAAKFKGAMDALTAKQRAAKK